MIDTDRDRVSKEDDFLRDASVLLDDGEVLVERVDSHESEDRDFLRSLYRWRYRER